MLPSKHLEELEKRENLRKRGLQILPFAVFVATFFLVAPLIHELSHIILLLFEGCRNSVEWGYSLTGLRAEVKPLCTLGSLKSSLFYLSGYLSSLVIGGIAFIFSGSSSIRDRVLKAIGKGFLLSIVATGTVEGDFFLLGSIWSVDPGITFSLIVLFSLAISMLILLGMMKLWSQKGSRESSRSP